MLLHGRCINTYVIVVCIRGGGHCAGQGVHVSQFWLRDIYRCLIVGPALQE